MKKERKQHEFPNGNPGSTKSVTALKQKHNAVIVEKNGEINYLRHQLKAMMVRTQKVLSAYHGTSTRHFIGGEDAKYCVCCGQLLIEPNESEANQNGRRTKENKN